jgi:hypothetical protein
MAYDDAAGRVAPDFTELGAGEIGGLTLAPGLYKWATGLLISTDVTLSGGPDDVWIFQVAGTLNQASATHVTLAGGAAAKNIFTASRRCRDHSEPTATSRASCWEDRDRRDTGATVNGRFLAQTAASLFR